MPRFSIHSWNDDQSVNEPWMYPEITSYVRDLIKFRYRLIPYLYDLMWRAHRDYAPIIRPTFHDFPDDEKCYAECDDMLLGENLLVAPVVEPDMRARTVYLPAGANWYDYWAGDYYHGGREIVLPAPWDRPPVLAKEGSVIPLNVAEQHFSKPADKPGFFIFPRKSAGATEYECFEDDGESEAYREGDFYNWRLQIQTTASRVLVTIKRDGKIGPGAISITLLLPSHETRKIEIEGASVVADGRGGMNRELLVDLG